MLQSVTKGGGGVKNGQKKSYIIFEWPLIWYSIWIIIISDPYFILSREKLFYTDNFLTCSWYHNMWKYIVKTWGILNTNIKHPRYNNMEILAANTLFCLILRSQCVHHIFEWKIHAYFCFTISEMLFLYHCIRYILSKVLKSVSHCPKLPCTWAPLLK